MIWKSLLPERSKSCVFFNIAGLCKPDLHYLLPPTDRLPDVQRLIDQQSYFVIYGSRQSGKTTAMLELARH